MRSPLFTTHSSLLTKKMLTVLLLLLAAVQAQAAEFDLKDITSGKFRAETMAEVTPLSNGESYAMITPDGRQVVSCSMKTGKQTAVLFDVATARGARLSRVDSYVMSPDGRRMLIATATSYIYRRSFTATYYIYHLANHTLEALSDGGPQQSPIWSPDGNQIAFVRNNNIHLVKLLYGNAESQVTTDGEKNKVINGVPDWVNEEEFSTACSMTFTADGRQIVWVRYDESAVPECSLMLFRGSHPAKDQYAARPGFYTYKYPKPGEPNAVVTLMSYDIKSHKTRQMNLPLPADGYIPRLKATADSSAVLAFTLNRHQDELKIYAANPLTTECRLLISDKVSHYIKEDVFAQTLVTPRHILLASERSGFCQLYLYNLKGQLLRTITQGKQPVTALYGYSEATGDTYYAATDEPTNQKVYIAHANGKNQCLTPQPGVSTAIFSTNHKYFIHQWSDIHTPPTYTLRTVAGKTAVTLINNHALAQTLANYPQAHKELITFTTGEGITLNAWMVKPANFNPAKHYPVVIYQYGGPGSQQVLNQWNIGMAGQGAALEQLMAQKGYIVVCVDGRGTGGRGAEFEKCTYMHLGELEAKDQVETALWLAKQSYIDKNKIGIWGWSFGGWNTLMSMSEGRPVFRAGIAIAPPTNWRYYDTIYTERFMRTPKENANGYDNICPIARAAQLSGALMLVHGLADDNVHYQNTAEYEEALVQADKDFTQLVYTNRNHGIAGGNTRNHLFRQCLNFFDQKMKE